MSPRDALTRIVGPDALADVHAIEFRSGIDESDGFEQKTRTFAYTSSPKTLVPDEALSIPFPYLVHDWLAPRFDGRSSSTIAPTDTDAFIVYLLTEDPIKYAPDFKGLDDRIRTVLLDLYPRLDIDAKRLANELLLHASFEGTLAHDVSPNVRRDLTTPQLQAAWVRWYRYAAPTLSQHELLSAANAVFDRNADPLLGLVPTDYAWWLLKEQVHAPSPRREATVLTCATTEHPNCGNNSPLFEYFGPSEHDDFHQAVAAAARARLIAALLAERDPRLTEFVLLRLFQQPAARMWKDDVLARLSSDPTQMAIGRRCWASEGGR